MAGKTSPPMGGPGPFGQPSLYILLENRNPFKRIESEFAERCDGDIGDVAFMMCYTHLADTLVVGKLRSA